MDNNTNQNVQSSETKNEVRPFLERFNLKIIIGVVVLLVVAFFVYSNYLSIEGRAKRCVNNYLGAIKSGEDTLDYKDIGVDDFINVLDYKFLSVKSVEKKKVILDLNRSDYNEYMREAAGKTYEQYVAEMKDIFSDKGEVINETNNSISVWNGEYYNELILLYDVNLTNALGSSLYKKVYFTVNNEYDTYKVVDISY